MINCRMVAGLVEEAAPRPPRRRRPQPSELLDGGSHRRCRSEGRPGRRARVTTPTRKPVGASLELSPVRRHGTDRRSSGRGGRGPRSPRARWRSPPRSARSGPTVSRVNETGTTPLLETRPEVGRMPVTPQKRCRDPDRAGRIGAERRGHEPRRCGGAAAAARAAADPIGRPRVSRRAEMRARRHCPERELVRVELADHDRPAARSASTVAASVGATFSARMRDARGRPRSGDVDHVLDGDRHAVERAARRLPVEGVCLGERLVGSDADERVELGVELGDPIAGSPRPRHARVSSPARIRSASAATCSWQISTGRRRSGRQRPLDLGQVLEHGARNA